MLRRLDLAAILIAGLSLSFWACSVNKVDSSGSGGSSAGGSDGNASGGTTATGGTDPSGGTTGSGGAGSGGVTSSGGSSAAGGATSSGGRTGSGGSSAAGGTTAAGGHSASGGTKSNGGATGTGGATNSGGSGNGGTTGKGGSVAGGTTSSGGTTSVGGTTSPGGNTGTGGTTSTGGTTASVACTDVSTTTKNFTKQYEDGSLAVTGSTKTYWTMTNWWHKFGGQTVSLNGLSMKVGNSQGASVPSSDGNPMGFPSIFIGTYQTKATVGSNLPKKVSDIKSVPTIFQTNASSLADTSNLNATYDVWFTATGDPLSSARASNPGAGGAYLMVWMFKPESRRPRGGVPQTTGDNTANFTAHAVPGVPGTWDVWIDKTDPLCISYVSSEPIDGLAYDLNNFIQDSVTNQYGITTSMYLSLVFGGTEIWSGGDGFEIKQFCAAVN